MTETRHPTAAPADPPAGPPTDWFHQAALAVGFVARAEGWLHDSDRVRRAVYALYEAGEWPGEADAHPTSAGVTTSPDPATPLPISLPKEEFMSRHYEAFPAAGREVVGGPVGTAFVRDTGEISVAFERPDETTAKGRTP